MKKYLVLPLLLLLCIPTATAQPAKHRLVILADMGNEPDEQQQMFHMLLYANEFDLEGLIAVTGKYLRPGAKTPYKEKLHPELFHLLIDGYAKIVSNLEKHARGWPTPDYLRSIVASGQSGYGINDVGTGKSSPGSDLLIKILEKDDQRPVYVVVNAGSNTLAQALFDYKARYSQTRLNHAVAKLRVFENGAQDNAGAWICSNFPNIIWRRSNYQTYAFAGPSGDGGKDNSGNKKNLGPYTWEPYAYSGVGQHQWALEHIIGQHGPFGNYYPLRQFPRGGIAFLEGGGTIPWFILIHQGLSDIEHAHWGSWSGRFTRAKVANVWSKHRGIRADESKYAPFYVYTEDKDSWTNPETGKHYPDNVFAPVWRWRRAFFNDFRGRMDWAKQPFAKANHNPIAAVNGDQSEKVHFFNAKAGSKFSADASASSDPDGDKLRFSWWIYPEAGTYPSKIKISGASKNKASLRIPKDASGKEIHLILEIKDDSPIVSMYDYRRLVLNITE